MPLSSAKKQFVLVFSVGWAHYLILTVQTNRKMSSVASCCTLRLNTVQCELLGFLPPHIYLIYGKLHLLRDCFNPMRKPSVSLFSTWICVQAHPTSLLESSGRQGASGRSGCPWGDQHKVLSSAPAEDSLDLLLGFVGSFFTPWKHSSGQNRHGLTLRNGILSTSVSAPASEK